MHSFQPLGRLSLQRIDRPSKQDMGPEQLATLYDEHIDHPLAVCHYISIRPVPSSIFQTV